MQLHSLVSTERTNISHEDERFLKLTEPVSQQNTQLCEVILSVLAERARRSPHLKGELPCRCFQVLDRATAHVKTTRIKDFCDKKKLIWNKKKTTSLSAAPVWILGGELEQTRVSLQGLRGSTLITPNCSVGETGQVRLVILN